MQMKALWPTRLKEENNFLRNNYILVLCFLCIFVKIQYIFIFYRKKIAANEVNIGKAADKLKEEKPVTLPSDDVTFKKWG